jgi:lipopolysaccharide transport protein LptA
MKLDAERLTNHREEGVIRAGGKARFERRGDSIHAEALTIAFADDRRTMKSLRARHGVSATVVTNPGLAANRIELSGQDLIIQFDPQTGLSRRLVLEAEEDDARLERISADSWVQGFQGRYLTAQFTAGTLRVIDGLGLPVILNETLDMPDGPIMLRQTCSRRIEMHFAAQGHATHLRLEGQVELADTEVYVGGGSQADVDFPQQLMRVSGPAVSLYHTDGQLTADAFIYHRGKRRLQAEGSVSAMLEERAGRVLSATPLGRGEGPIFVESEKATWSLDPASFIFSGNVRAWRRDNLILAEQLRGDDAKQQISAGGSVKTLWAPDVVPGSAVPAPIEIAAKQMVYDRMHSALIYSGDVEAVQAGRRLDCDQLTVLLTGTDGTTQQMNCDGDVLLDDPALGRQVEGERAVYRLASDLIEVTGDPVIVREADGSTVRCRYFSYNTASGAIEIRSAPPAADEMTTLDDTASDTVAPRGTGRGGTDLGDTGLGYTDSGGSVP